jgi:hypothetical protein
LEEHEKLVSAVKQVDVVISTLAVPQHLDQLKIISAMKEAGNIKVSYNYTVSLLGEMYCWLTSTGLS